MRPKRFGPYVLETRLGVGGMAEVFLARRRGGPRVALKRLLPYLSQDPEFVTLFADEVRIARRLDHPNVVRVLDHGQAGGSEYLAMEYIRGADLGHAIAAAAGPLDAGLALYVAGEMMRGLAYIHSFTMGGRHQGLVHRDLSPENVLLGADGGVRIADFGIARARDRATRTATGVCRGKAPYMSPEQTRGAEVDLRSDLFSAGVLIWEMLAGRRLFAASSVEEEMHAVRERPLRPPSAHNPLVQPPLDGVVLRALARDPRRRPADANALRDELEAVRPALDRATGRGRLALVVGSIARRAGRRRPTPVLR